MILEPDPRTDSVSIIWNLAVDGSPAIVASEQTFNYPFWPIEGMISSDHSWIAYPIGVDSADSGLQIARIDGTEDFEGFGFGNGAVTSINWSPGGQYLAAGIRRGTSPLHLVHLANRQAYPVGDAVLEEIIWIDSSHFLYHSGNFDHPMLSIGDVGGASESIIEFDDAPNAITHFIVYDIAK